MYRSMHVAITYFFQHEPILCGKKKVRDKELRQNQPTKRWRTKCNISLMYITRGYCYMIIIIIKTKIYWKNNLREFTCDTALQSLLHLSSQKDSRSFLLCTTFIVFFFFTYHTMEMMSKSMEHLSSCTYFFLSFFFLIIIAITKAPPHLDPSHIDVSKDIVPFFFVKLLNHARNVLSLK